MKNSFYNWVERYRLHRADLRKGLRNWPGLAIRLLSLVLLILSPVLFTIQALWEARHDFFEGFSHLVLAVFGRHRE